MHLLRGSKLPVDFFSRATFKLSKLLGSTTASLPHCLQPSKLPVQAVKFYYTASLPHLLQPSKLPDHVCIYSFASTRANGPTRANPCPTFLGLRRSYGSTRASLPQAFQAARFYEGS